MKALTFRATGEAKSVLQLAEMPTPPLATGEAASPSAAEPDPHARIGDYIMRTARKRALPSATRS